jgi:hypothetical protein
VYTVTAVNANGCVATTTFVINQPVAITAANIGATPSCPGQNNGTIHVSGLSGGFTGGPYQISNNGGANYITYDPNLNPTFTGLAPAIYTIVARDVNGCTYALGSVTIITSSPVNVVTSIVNATCTGSNDGSITATGSGGSGNYTYSLSGPGGTTQQTSGGTVTFTSLPAGTYSLTTSASGSCPTITTLTVGATQGSGGGTTDLLFNLESMTPPGNVFPAVGSSKSITYSVLSNNAAIQGVIVTITKPASTFTVVLTFESQANWEEHSDQDGFKEFRLKPGVTFLCNQKILISVNITRGASQGGRTPITANARYRNGAPDPNEFNNTRAAQFDLQ